MLARCERALESCHRRRFRTHALGHVGLRQAETNSCQARHARIERTRRRARYCFLQAT